MGFLSGTIYEITPDLVPATIDLDLCPGAAGIQTALVASGTLIDVPAGLTLPLNGIEDGPTGAVWTVRNEGTVTAEGDGVSLQDAGSAVVNLGAINGNLPAILALPPGSRIDGVSLAAGGSVDNQLSATIAGYDVGIHIDAGAGTITNAGTISGQGIAGMALTLGGTVVNTGAIAGTGTAAVGIDIGGGSGTTITNTGTINGAFDGIIVANTGATVINSGTIVGGLGAAIRFDQVLAQADTLELHPGSSISGDVLAGAGAATDSFVLGGNGAGSFDVSQIGVQYQDFDAFIKEGSSRWTLTGDNLAMTDGWAVNQGTLQVDANLSASPFNVATAGTLAGGGTIGNLSAGGTVAPGTTNGTGVLTVNGSAIIGPGSTLLVGITDSGAADRLQVTGATSVDADTTVAVTALPGDYTDPFDYVVLTSGGGVTGAFGDVVDTVPDVDFVAHQEANRTVLTIVPARGGAETTSPKEMFPAAVVSAVGNSRVLVDGLRRRAGRVAGTRLGDRSVLAYDEPGIDSDGFPAAALGLNPVHKQAVGGDGGTDYRAWNSVIGRVSSVESDGTIRGYDVTMGGVVLGIEAAPEWLEANGLVGISGGWMTSQTEAGGAQANVDAWHLALYGVSLWGPWEISGGLGVALLDYTTERWVSWDGGEVRGDGETAGHAISGSFLAAYDYGPRLGYERLVFAPYASVDGAHATREGMKESGAGLLNLSVARDDLTRAWTALGLRIGTSYGTDKVQFRPQVELAWGHVVGSLSPATVSTISAANAVFVTEVAAEDRNTLQFGGNLDISFRETFGANLRYKGEFGSASTSHRVGAGLKVRF